MPSFLLLAFFKKHLSMAASVILVATNGCFTNKTFDYLNF